MPCAVGWAGTQISGKPALQGDHEFSSMGFSPDALPASQVKGHTVDYNTYEEVHFFVGLFWEETVLSIEGGHFWLMIITLSGE
jgi:hypothetical protein